MSRTLIRRCPGSGLLAIAAIAIATAPASADDRPTRWDLRIDDATEHPAHEGLGDFVSFEYRDGSWTGIERVTLTVTRGGAVVSRDEGSWYGEAYVSVPALQPGDLIKATGPLGTKLATYTYDGRPSFAPSTCVGSTAFRGARTGGNVQSVYAFTWELEQYTEYPSYPEYPGYPNYPGYPGYPGYPSYPSDPWTYEYWYRGDWNPGLVTELTGEQFAGTFERPLPVGSSVVATEVQWVSPTLRLIASREQDVDACPTPEQPAPQPPAAEPIVPDAPAPPATPGPGPSAADAKAPVVTLGRPSRKTLKQLTRSKLQKRGLTFTATADEPALATATLLVRNGSGKGKKAKAPRTLATTSVQLTAGAPGQLKLRPTKKALRHLKGLKKGSQLLVQITVTDRAGNVARVPAVALAPPKR